MPRNPLPPGTWGEIFAKLISRDRPRAGRPVRGEDSVLEMVNKRWIPGTSLDAPLFPASNGGFRDPHNVQRAFRDARRPVGGRRRTELGKALKSYRRAAGLDELAWVTSHKFRKTTATILDDAGQSARLIAGQLGQADTTTTMNSYIGRKARNPEAARILDAALRSIHDQDREPPTRPAI